MARPRIRIPSLIPKFRMEKIYQDLEIYHDEEFFYYGSYSVIVEGKFCDKVFFIYDPLHHIQRRSALRFKAVMGQTPKALVQLIEEKINEYVANKA